MARKGLPKSIIKKYGITKKAWRVFRGKKKSRSRSRPKGKGRTSSKRRNPPRKSGGGRVARGKSLYRSVMKLIKVGAIVGPGVFEWTSSRGPTRHKVSEVLKVYSGFSIERGDFQLGRLVNGWGPYVAVNLVEKGLAFVNRLLRSI